MSEYWKSVPRKFCDFCKCWITDNRPSVDFHERGKRHIENVELRLREVRKKSLRDSIEQEELGKQMEQMEKAALEAFKKDLKNNPELASQYGVSLEPKPVAKDSDTNKPSSDEKSNKRKSPQEKEWYEAVTPEGYSYYWSTKTAESRWTAPDEFVSIVDQEAEKLEEDEASETMASTSYSTTDTTTSVTTTSESASSETTTRVDPSFSRTAYGSWEVVKEVVQPVVYDESSAPPELDGIPLPSEMPGEARPQKSKYKEKTVTSLGSALSGPVAFKKRKVAHGARNSRQRDDED